MVMGDRRSYGEEKSQKSTGSLTVDYVRMGVMTIDELKQALWTDLQILKDERRVKYIKAPRLKLQPTDENGEPAPVRDRDGKTLHRMHTYHYRPACMDYDFS